MRENERIESGETVIWSVRSKLFVLTERASLASTVADLKTVLQQQAEDMIEGTRDKDKAEAGSSFSLIASLYSNCVSLQSWHSSNAVSNAAGARRAVLMVRTCQKYLPEREGGTTARICKNSCQHSWPYLTACKLEKFDGRSRLWASQKLVAIPDQVRILGAVFFDH